MSHTCFKSGLLLSVMTFSMACSAQEAPIAPLPPERVAEMASMLPATPAGFGVPCSTRAAWTPMVPRLKDEVRHAEQLQAKPLPPWNDDLYLEYTRKGTRPAGEAMIRDHDGQLSTLVLAECAEWRGRFLPRIAEQLDAISAQRSWTLPAHDGNLENFNGTRYYVDLGASSLSRAVAETLYLLGDSLPEPTRKRAMAALELRIFAPMRDSIAGRHREFWFHRSSNWNAVCWAGVAGSALTVLPDREQRALFAAAAQFYGDAYLNSYTLDGYAEEGIGYWGYGFSNYEQLREYLWIATSGKVDLYDNPRAQKSALFPFQFQMLPGVYADFGDARFGVKPNMALMTRVDRIFALNMFPGQSDQEQISGALPDAMLNAFPVPSERRSAAAAHGFDALVGLRTFYPEAGVLVSRPQSGGKLAVTIKANGNAGHSHNDIGSFSIGLGSTQPVGDPGGPVAYIAGTFGPKRFQSRLLNSFGHPVPALDGQLQLDATTVKAAVLSESFAAGQDRISLDLSKAYIDPKLTSLVRTLTYNRSGAGMVTIDDHFQLNGPMDVEESLPTHGRWTQLNPTTLRFDLDDAHLKVVVSGGAFTVKADVVDEYGQSFTRVGLHLHLEKSGTVTMAFTPIG